MAETSATSLDEGDPDQILNDWALTPADLEQIRRARSRDSRLWAALHLCSLRRTARFLDDLEQIPRGALTYLARQLADTPPVRLQSLPRPTAPSAPGCATTSASARFPSTPRIASRPNCLRPPPTVWLLPT